MAALAFRAVAEVGCSISCGRKGFVHPNELPDSVGLTRCSALEKPASAAASWPFAFEKYADRYLGAFSYRFNRRSFQSGGNDRACGFMPSAAVSHGLERLLRCAEFATNRVIQSSAAVSIHASFRDPEEQEPF